MPNNADATKRQHGGRPYSAALATYTDSNCREEIVGYTVLCFRRDPFRPDPCNLCWRLRDVSHNVSGAEEIDHHEADLRL